tara:strand:- start:359 stop:478 length:120 start_codon:yes stop_codon:yes gene_type:complete
MNLISLQHKWQIVLPIEANGCVAVEDSVESSLIENKKGE